MTTSAELLKKLHKDHGKTIAQVGDEEYEDIPRIPTGVFPLDLAIGGGFPQGKCSEIYGPESSNKTNLLLGAIREGQVMFPDHKAVFCDAEHALDRKWARDGMGVDMDRLIILQPESAEQAVDMIEAFTYAEDVFLIGLDSIAALTTQREIDNASEVVNVGGSTILVGKMFRKMTVAQTKMVNEGKRPPTFIAINQIRNKVGQTRGDPETTPGGFAPRFAASMRLRTYGKNVMDSKVHKTLPAWKHCNIIVKKWKCPIIAPSVEFDMQMVEANGNKPGFIKDWNTIAAYMKELDYLSKGEKGGWVMNGEPYNTLDECKDALYADPAVLQDMKATLIKELMANGGLAAQEATGEIPTEDE